VWLGLQGETARKLGEAVHTFTHTCMHTHARTHNAHTASTWLCGQYDPSHSVAQQCGVALAATFPGEKMARVLAVCRADLLAVRCDAGLGPL
jgi:hypothetical protein